MSKFQKVEKHNSLCKEKMEGEIIMSELHSTNEGSPSTHEGSPENMIMCTIKSTDICPVGFVSSSNCIGDNNNENTHYCQDEPSSK